MEDLNLPFNFSFLVFLISHKACGYLRFDKHMNPIFHRSKTMVHEWSFPNTADIYLLLMALLIT